MKNLMLFFAFVALISAACKQDQKTVEETRKPTLERAENIKVNPAKSTASPKTMASAGSGDVLIWNSINDLKNLKNKDGKKILVDVYTDWCGWCKVMDKKTFSDPTVIAYLNENFHLIKFNAEQRDVIKYGGKEYKWIPAGRKGVNQFAQEMLDGRLGYPSLVYYDSDLTKLRVSPGFKDPAKLLTELKAL